MALGSYLARRSPRTRLLALVAGVMWACAHMAWAQEPAPGELEQAVKAEFVERFTHFVEWPPASFPTPESPFLLCVIGAGPLVPSLEKLAARRKLQDRPTRFTRLRDAGEAHGCHILYIAPDQDRGLPRILDQTAGSPILTIGDTPGFAARGVLINLYVEQGYVRFEINVEAVKRSHLKISAKLMSLARVIGAP